MDDGEKKDMFSLRMSRSQGSRMRGVSRRQSITGIPLPLWSVPSPSCGSGSLAHWRTLKVGTLGEPQAPNTNVMECIAIHHLSSHAFHLAPLRVTLPQSYDIPPLS